MMDFFKSDGARTGLFFGASSGVITTLGLITGLNAGTHSMTAVLGGILVIAVADAMSDALGIHLAEEANPDKDHRHVWQATIATFITKFLFALSFVIPLLLLPLGPAVIASIAWGMLVIVVLSYFLARSQNESPWPSILEHLGIAILVVVLSHLIGVWVATTFG
jgi:VIT1/CCC1 family predicted Fe2+/Mn2+ transporter